MLFKFNHRRDLTIVSSHLDRLDRARLGLPGRKLFLRCDGKADQEELLEAIDSLPNNPGGNIKYTWGAFDHGAEVPIEKSAVLIQGAGKATEIDLSAVGIDGFVFGDGSTGHYRSGIRDLKITSSVTKNGGSAVKFDKLTYGYASGLYIEKQFCGYFIEGSSLDIRITDFEIMDCIAANGVGVLVGSDTNTVDVFLSRGVISAAQGSEPSVGIAGKNVSGLYLSDISIAFQKYGVNFSPDSAGNSIEYVFAHKVLTDNCTVDGWGIGPAGGYTVRGVWLDHCWGCTCLYGFNISQAGTIYAVYLDHPMAMNNLRHGIYVTSGSEIHIRDPHTTDNSKESNNTYSGIHVGAITDWSIKGGRSTDDLHIGSTQQKYGIEVAAGGADRYQIVGVDVRGNQTAGIIDGGTGTDKTIRDNPGSTIDDLIADPGDAGAIPVTQSGHVALVTGGAETRTMAIPSVMGTEIHLSLKTDGGDCVVTVAGPVNVAGNTVLTFDNESEHILLKAIDANGTLEWAVMANDGVGLGP